VVGHHAALRHHMELPTLSSSNERSWTCAPHNSTRPVTSMYLLGS
jgi:hypothetical protein